MQRREIIKKYAEHIEKDLERIYSDGYSEGYKTAREEFGSHQRGICYCKPASEEEIKQYGIELHGWCSECKKALEGRWLGLANFCPWCGRVINWEVGKENKG